MPKRNARKILRGFTFFEVILYLGLFAALAPALFQFFWNVLDLGNKDYASRRVFSDARLATERIDYFIRNAESIDTDNSVFDNANGKLVLNKFGGSGTLTLAIEDNKIMVAETGQPAAALNGPDSRVTGFTLTRYGDRATASEYVDFTLTLQSAQYDTARAPYQAATTLRAGAFLRNSGTSL